MLDKKATLSKLNKNLNILKEREAKFAGQAPLALLNQINDHEQAIDLTRQAITGEISEEEWEALLKPLLLAVNNGQVINIEAETYVAGDVEGDVVSGDKILGDKIITVTYNAPPPSLPPAEVKERRNLGILLKKVKTFWIEGVLEKSVHRVALIDLDKESQTEAVDHVWEEVLELPDQSRQTLPHDKKVSQIFDELNRAMLILGDPGSGKTITLLQLAQDLIAQLEADETFSQPVPVVFNLSSWTDREQPLVDWLIAELSAKYQIPKRIGRPWLENHRLLPLLDGLDEVEPKNRAACVEAINCFGEEFGLAGLVVCSRLQEYLSLPVRLKLNGAVCLKPLTSTQIDNYLKGMGSKLDALRKVLLTDGNFQSLAQSPLMLNIMCLVYQDASVDTLTDQVNDSVEARRKHLFDIYSERMFRRKGIDENITYSNEQSTFWLSWLAQKMTQHGQTIFLIEDLQPSWLLSRFWQWGYVFASRLISAMFLGLFLAISFLVDGDFISTGQVMVSVTLLGGVIALIDVVRFEQGRKKSLAKKSRSWWRLVINIAAVSLIIGLIIWTQLGWLGLPVGLLFGFLFGARGSRQGLTSDIQHVERLKWSWRGFLRKGILGVILGLILGATTQLLSSGEIIWTFVLGVALVGGIIGSFFGGLATNIEQKDIPNQGIKLLLRNAVFAGLIFGPLFPAALLGSVYIFNTLYIILGMTNEWYHIQQSDFIFILTFVPLLGGIAFLWYGFFDVIQHYTLRLILYYQNRIALDYGDFLDYAAERIFLRRVGGGYIFLHRYLMEYFSDLNPKQTQTKKVTDIIFDSPKQWKLRASLVFGSILIILGILSPFIYREVLADTYAKQCSNSARLGDAKQVIDSCSMLVELEPNNENYLNMLCWFGSLSGHAADVLYACERAVELDGVGTGKILASRGLALALMGDYSRAAEDFRFASDWYKRNKPFDEWGPLLEKWAIELEGGQNPFDEAMIQELLQM